MPHKKGVSTRAFAARFRLFCRNAYERAIEFGPDSFRVPGSGLPSKPTLDACLVQLLQFGVARAEIVHFRGHVCVARLQFCREGFPNG